MRLMMLAFLFPLLAGPASAADALPDAIAAPGETVVLTVHAEGAQVYECKAGADGKLAWAFREPIATLAGRRQDDRPALCRTELGAHRRQRRGRQSRWQRAGRDAERYRLAEAASGRLTRQRRPDRRHHRAADQHQGRQVGRRLRQGRHLQVRALLGGVRVPEEGLTLSCPARGAAERCAADAGPTQIPKLWTPDQQRTAVALRSIRGTRAANYCALAPCGRGQLRS